MTAEVAVINKSAVALAADSAVTVVTQDSSGNRTDKIFNTANKLFTLSKYHPVGIMVNNTMELGGVPWETIIKQFRNKELKDKSFGTLAEYRDHFFYFLESNGVLFPRERQDEIVTRILMRYFSKISERINSNPEAKNVFQNEIAELEKSENALGFSDDFAIDIERKYERFIDQAASEIFKVSYIRNLKRVYRRLASLALTKENLLEGHSGIVFAGFGETEVFPSVYEYNIDAVVDGHIKRSVKRSFTPSNLESGKVLGFAQDDIIKTILQGVNPDYYKEVLNQTIKLIVKLPNDIIDQISELTKAQKEKYKQGAGSSVIPMAEDFFKKLAEKAHKEHTFQIERAISVMPFSELATVAEVFINLTQIRQRMSLEAETVGGPIDVAVISKADGFIWIKRKHYFDTELNHSFLANYFR